MIPGIGPLVGKLGGMGAEALVDWLRGFLTKPDIDLLLDPAKKLTADFLADLQKAADRRRIVLMLDTFEQMTALEDWAREVAQQLPANVLLVIAGRALPNWDRAWAGWMANAQVEELKPMSDDDMRELVRRYYAMLRGGEPDPKQVEAIIRFARGLPMVVTSAVQLWVRYPDTVGDFQAIKPYVVADLVDRLMEGVPKAMVPALEAAAAVRWFDQPILRAVMVQEDVRDAYNELRRFPFVRTRAEGLALHDAVREIMDENLRVQDAERHRELHERAAAYFERRLEKARGEEAERLGLERLYHRIRADEETGIQLFQEVAEVLVRHRLISHLRTLLNDVSTYELEQENSKLWKEYYTAELEFLVENLEHAQWIFQEICKAQQADSKLLGYAFSSWAKVRRRSVFLFQEGGMQKVIELTERSNQFLPDSEPRRVDNVVHLGTAYYKVGEIDKAITYLEQAIEAYERIGNNFGVVSVCRQLIGLYARVGNWQKMFEARLLGLNSLSQEANPYLYADIATHWAVAWAWAGRLAESEQIVSKHLRIKMDAGDTLMSGAFRDLILLAGLQGKYELAARFYESAMENHNKIYYCDDPVALEFYAMVLAYQGLLKQAQELYERSLELKPTMHSPGPAEPLNGMGRIQEMISAYDEAEGYYLRSLTRV
jgi:tetratricopeptide (TPR) repeat protein